MPIDPSRAKLRSLAQSVTIGAAMLTAAVWAVTLATDTSSLTDVVQAILISVTAVGGMCMGILYAFDWWQGRKSAA